MRLGSEDLQKEMERFGSTDPERISYTNGLAERWFKWGVRWTLKRYRQSLGKVSEEDVGQSVKLAILCAAREYESERGHFPTFAKYFIRSEMARLLARGRGPVSFPRNWKAVVKPLAIVVRDMKDRGETVDIDKALASLEGKTETEIAHIRDVWEAAGRKVEVKTWKVYARESPESVQATAEAQDESDRLREAMVRLPRLHREVFKDMSRGIFVEETGLRLGIAKQTVYTYRKRSLEWVRYWMGAGPKPDPMCTTVHTLETING